MIIFFILATAIILLIGAVLYFTNNGYNPVLQTINQDNLFIDIDGAKYATKTIGNKTWMIENFARTTDNNGKALKNIRFYIDLKSNGVLYQGILVSKAVNFVPKGWRIPTDEDYKVLERNFGMELSEIEKSGWRKSNGVATMLKENDCGLFNKKEQSNSSQFRALPTGVMSPKEKFIGLNQYCDYWTQTESNGKLVNRSMTWLTIHPGKNKIYRNEISKDWFFSIRLVRCD